MSCSKQFTIEVLEAFPEPLAWWTMDLGSPTSETDSVNGLALAALAGAGFMTTQPGKVNNSYQQVSSVGLSPVSGCSSALLALSGTQGKVTLVSWVNLISIATPFVANFSGYSFQFVQNGTTHFVNFQMEADGFWHITLDFIGTLTLPIPVGWHFVVATCDAATGEMGISINNSAMTTQVPGGPFTPGANTTAQIFVGTDANDAWTVRYDEFAIFDVILDAAQIDYLYNSGAGRTYPP